MERILSIQNLSLTPVTIEGVLLTQNAIMYPTIEFWRTDAWKILTTSTTLSVSLTTGLSFTLLANPDEYANAFIRTANYIAENYLTLLELEKPQGQITTTNNTTTTITEIALPNGKFNFEILVRADEVGTNNNYAGIFIPNVSVLANVATVAPSFTTAGIVARTGLGGGVGANGLGVGNRLRITVTGQSGKTLIWTVKILRRN